MQVGDLVKHTLIERLGIVLRTPEETGNGDHEVYYSYGMKGYWNKRWMKLVQESS
tara:strand:- start:446 stop:610 length:165 start_codon:yes stop_codon:yes gene_type:complete